MSRLVQEGMTHRPPRALNSLEGSSKRRSNQRSSAATIPLLVSNHCSPSADASQVTNSSSTRACRWGKGSGQSCPAAFSDTVMHWVETFCRRKMIRISCWIWGNSLMAVLTMVSRSHRGLVITR